MTRERGIEQTSILRLRLRLLLFLLLCVCASVCLSVFYFCFCFCLTVMMSRGESVGLLLFATCAATDGDREVF
jgi:hypothetical protein